MAAASFSSLLSLSSGLDSLAELSVAVVVVLSEACEGSTAAVTGRGCVGCGVMESAVVVLGPGGGLHSGRAENIMLNIMNIQ